MTHPAHELMHALQADAPQLALALPPTDGEFVRAVYQSVLGRSDVDAAALDFWTDALQNADAGTVDDARAALIHTLVYSEFSRHEDGLWGQQGEPHSLTDVQASLADIEHGVDFERSPTQVSLDGTLMAAGETAGTALALIGQADAGFTLI